MFGKGIYLEKELTKTGRWLGKLLKKDQSEFQCSQLVIVQGFLWVQVERLEVCHQPIVGRNADQSHGSIHIVATIVYKLRVASSFCHD